MFLTILSSPPPFRFRGSLNPEIALKISIIRSVAEIRSWRVTCDHLRVDVTCCVHEHYGGKVGSEEKLTWMSRCWQVWIAFLWKHDSPNIEPPFPSHFPVNACLPFFVLDRASAASIFAYSVSAMHSFSCMSAVRSLHLG